jgi:DNA-directed RNA polymerase subunit RPC12/RpoP
LRNLPQYRHKTDEELKAIAEAKDSEAEKFLDDMDVASLFTDIVEQKAAKVLLSKYLQDYELETISDKNILKQLIYLEVFQSRLQTSAEEFQKERKAVPLQILDSIHKNVDKIILLKEKLGLTRDVKTTQSDAYKTFETIEHKARLWRENNQATRRRVCPHCSKLVMWKIRPEAWEAQKHPFFKDRILYNTHIVKLYKQEKLSKEDVAAIFECSTDYIEWLIKRWDENKK